MGKYIEVFGKEYAYAYDFLYRDKGYKKECDFIQDIFEKYSLKPKTILDLGCGTGGHGLILAKDGFKVTGIDRSKEMLTIAQNKAREQNLDIKFINGDMVKLNIKKKYDVVIAMFAVIGYQTDNNAMAKICNKVANLLPNNGVFIFDCWHGYGILNEKPTMRVKEVKLNGKEKIIRFSEPTVDILNHTVEIKFKVRQLKDGRLVKETFESHLMRFWFPQEIKYYLKVAGFKKIDFCPFLGLNKALTEQHWNMTVIAQA